MDYSELKTAIIDFPDLKGEVELASYIDLIILLAETRISRDVHLAGGIKTVNVVGSVDTYQLPADCLEVDRIAITDGTKLEQYTAYRVILAQAQTQSQTTVYAFAIDGRQLIFSPEVGDFILKYYAREEALSVVSTNWLLTKAPDLYLYAGLCEAARFSKEAQQEYGRYEETYNLIVASLIHEDLTAASARSIPLIRRT